MSESGPPQPQTPAAGTERGAPGPAAPGRASAGHDDKTSARSDTYLSVPEAAQLLGVTDATIRRWIRQGNLPASTIDGRYVIARRKLELWARAHHMVLRKAPADAERGEQVPRPVLFLEAMKRGGVFFGIEAANMGAALREAVRLAPIPDSIDREDLLRRILEREALSSTGVGKGVAIPHPRAPLTGASFDPMITTCFLKNAIPYNAIDGVPVSVLFLALAPTVKLHLELLSALSFHLRSPKFTAVLRSSDPPTFYARLEELQAQLKLRP